MLVTLREARRDAVQKGTGADLLGPPRNRGRAGEEAATRSPACRPAHTSHEAQNTLSSPSLSPNRDQSIGVIARDRRSYSASSITSYGIWA